MGNIQVTLVNISVNIPGCPRRSSNLPHQFSAKSDIGAPNRTPSSSLGIGSCSSGPQSESSWSLVRQKAKLTPNLKVLKISLKIVLRRRLAAAFAQLSAKTKLNKKRRIKDAATNRSFSSLGNWLNLNKEFRHKG